MSSIADIVEVNKKEDTVQQLKLNELQQRTVEVEQKSLETQNIAEQYYKLFIEMREEFVGLLREIKETELKYKEELTDIQSEKKQKIEIEKRIKEIQDEIILKKNVEQELSIKFEQLNSQYTYNQEQLSYRESELKKLLQHLNNLENDLLLQQKRTESLQKAKHQEEQSIIHNSHTIKKLEEEIRHTNEQVTEFTECLSKLLKEVRLLHKKERLEKERSVQKEQEIEEKEKTSGVQIEPEARPEKQIPEDIKRSKEKKSKEEKTAEQKPNLVKRLEMKWQKSKRSKEEKAQPTQSGEIEKTSQIE